MKNILWFLAVLVTLLSVALLAWGFHNLGPMTLTSPGEIFIRQQAKDPKAYQAEFLAQAPQLKGAGFTAYSFHRDLKDPKTLITTLKCSHLGRGVAFVQSPQFTSALDKSGARIPQVWYGIDQKPRVYGGDFSPKPAGIVIARNEVRDYAFWLKCFFAEDGGRHNHPGRHYKNSDYSIHYLLFTPAVALVAHEASDVSKAPAFMGSDPLVGEMQSTGVIGLDVWYGINLSEGTF